MFAYAPDGYESCSRMRHAIPYALMPSVMRWGRRVIPQKDHASSKGNFFIPIRFDNQIDQTSRNLRNLNVKQYKNELAPSRLARKTIFASQKRLIDP